MAAIKNVFIVGAVCLTITNSALANNVGQSVQIPMKEEGLLWSSNINLEATLYKPEGEGPFPTVIFNHGSTGPNVIPEDHTINPWGFGEYLVNKNIALLIPMRRGRGQSEGSYKERYTCDPKGIEEGLDYAMQSLDASYDYLLNQPWVDKEKVLLTGNSRGGILSLAYASEHPDAFSGVINFSGGWVDDSCNNNNTSMNIPIFENAGSTFKAPALFIYGRSDSYYSDTTIESFARSYEQSGGNVDFKFYQLGKNVSGHDVFYKYGHLWSYVVDQYLIDIQFDVRP